RLARFHSIHFRLHCYTQRCRAYAWPPVTEPADDSDGVRTERGVDHSRLATALSRHGPDWKRIAIDVLWRAMCSDVAAQLPAKTSALAPGDHTLPGDHQRWAKLRIRPVRAQNWNRRKRETRSTQLDRRLQRCRTDPHGHY